MSEKRTQKSDPERFKNQVAKVFEDVLNLSNRPKNQEEENAISDKTSALFDELTELKDSLDLEPSPFPDLPVEKPEVPAIAIDATTEIDQAAPRTRKYFWELAFPLLIAISVYFLFGTVYLKTKVIGPSMEPSISNNDFLFVNKLAYSSKAIQRGDVIVFHNPENPEEILVKRVVGIPGDQVEIIGGWLFVNNAMFDEPYLGTPDIFDTPEITVPQDMVFVLGDNRRFSSDSRDWGPLSIRSILGRADFVYWPIRHSGLVEHFHSALSQP
jgi:signal peptidase I